MSKSSRRATLRVENRQPVSGRSVDSHPRAPGAPRRGCRPRTARPGAPPRAPRPRRRRARRGARTTTRCAPLPTSRRWPRRRALAPAPRAARPLQDVHARGLVRGRDHLLVDRGRGARRAAETRRPRGRRLGAREREARRADFLGALPRRAPQRWRLSSPETTPPRRSSVQSLRARRARQGPQAKHDLARERGRAVAYRTTAWSTVSASFVSSRRRPENSRD